MQKNPMQPQVFSGQPIVKPVVDVGITGKNSTKQKPKHKTGKETKPLKLRLK